MTRSLSRIRVLIDTPPYFVRPKNTDWLYMKALSALTEHVPLEIIYSFSHADAVEESMRYLTGRMGLNRESGADEYRRSGRYIAQQARQVDVVLCHRRYPIGIDRPVIWQHAVLDPRMTIAAGLKPEAVEQAYSYQGEIYSVAAAVQVSTNAEAQRHASMFPLLAERFHAVPFFLPHIKPVSDLEVTEKHQNDKVIRILFVGREAHRKGLDVLVKAINALPAEILAKLQFDIVSTRSGPFFEIPPHPAINHHSNLPRGQVLDLMHAAHIFAMPSRYESYGFTLVEAMANGCAVIGPDWEVQSELLNYGQAGVNVEPQVEAILRSLVVACSNQQERSRIARAGLERYLGTYAPEKVALAYYRMVEKAVSHGNC